MGVGVLLGGSGAAPCPATPTAQFRSGPRRLQRPQQLQQEQRRQQQQEQQQLQDGERRCPPAPACSPRPAPGPRRRTPPQAAYAQLGTGRDAEVSGPGPAGPERRMRGRPG